MYRVIVADDESEFRPWLREMLERADDFLVLGEASSGEETLRLVNLLMPDVVIADVDMPGQDGLDVARYLKEHLLAIMVILVSGHNERSYARLALEEGAVAFITKSRLSLEAIRQALRGGR